MPPGSGMHLFEQWRLIVILRLINLNLEFYSNVQLLQSSYKSMEDFKMNCY